MTSFNPASLMGGRAPRDAVGTLGQSVLDRDGDAAIAFLNGARSWLPFVFGNFIHPRGVRDSILGEVLVKSGRTTGQTRAKVDGEGIFRIRYRTALNTEEVKAIRGFKMVSTTFGNPDDEELSSGGDSGSLWVDPKDGEAVGLHFAGETDPNPRAEHAIACNMTSVLRRLDVRLATAEDLVAGMAETSTGPSQPNSELNLAPTSGFRGSMREQDIDALLYAYEQGRRSPGKRTDAGASIESVANVAEVKSIVNGCIGEDPVNPMWKLSGKPLLLDADGRSDLRSCINENMVSAGLPGRVSRTEMRNAVRVRDLYDAAL